MKKINQERVYNIEYEELSFGIIKISKEGVCKVFVLPARFLKQYDMKLGDKFECNLFDYINNKSIYLGVVTIKKRGTSKGIFIPLKISNKHNIEVGDTFICNGKKRKKQLIATKQNDDEILVKMTKKDFIIYKRFREEEDELQHISDTILGEEKK